MILLSDFYQSSLGNNNLTGVRYDLYHMTPSIDDPTVTLVTMINGALIQDIEKKSIGTFHLLFSKQNYTRITVENSPAFCTFFLSAF